MKVRKAVEKDLGTLERIFDKARLFMKESGNPAQWIDGYPAPDRIMADIKNGDCYCVVDDAGHVVGTFAFIVGEDPNYKEIRNGSWCGRYLFPLVSCPAGKHQSRYACRQ